jgi:rRNA maturation protein Nop10
MMNTDTNTNVSTSSVSGEATSNEVPAVFASPREAYSITMATPPHNSPRPQHVKYPNDRKYS